MLVPAAKKVLDEHRPIVDSVIIEAHPSGSVPAMRTALILLAFILLTAALHAEPTPPPTTASEIAWSVMIDPAHALALPEADDAIGVPDFHSDSIIQKLPPAAALALTESQRASEGDVRAMLRSDNPTLVSLGLYAADFQSRPDILAEAFWLAGDTRPALPRLTTNPVNGELGVIPSSQTIGERYKELVDFWIPNLPSDESALRESLAAGVDVWANARTWALRLHRVKRNGTLEELHNLKAEFAAVPETIQWVTLLDPSVTGRPAVFTKVEIKIILDNLSPDTNRKIADRTIELPRDYKRLRDKGNEELLDQLFDRYDALTRSP